MGVEVGAAELDARRTADEAARAARIHRAVPQASARGLSTRRGWCRPQGAGHAQLLRMACADQGREERGGEGGTVRGHGARAGVATTAGRKPEAATGRKTVAVALCGQPSSSVRVWVCGLQRRKVGARVAMAWGRAAGGAVCLRRGQEQGVRAWQGRDGECSALLAHHPLRWLSGNTAVLRSYSCRPPVVAGPTYSVEYSVK